MYYPLLLMTRLQRYVLNEIVAPAGLGVLFFTGILIIRRFFFVAKMALDRDLSILAMGKLLTLLLPAILVYTIPMGVLLGVLVGLARLAADGEVTAMRACGIGPTHLIIPVMFFSGVASGVDGVLYNYVVPAANHMYVEESVRLIREMDLSRVLRPGVFFEEIPGCRSGTPGSPPGARTSRSPAAAVAPGRGSSRRSPPERRSAARPSRCSAAC